MTSSDSRRLVIISARPKVTIILVLAATILLSICDVSYSNDDEVTYSTLFGVDLAENHKAVWQLFMDPEQESGKFIEERNVRAVFVGRYDDFKEQFERDSYSRLSLYRSPFQAKILFINHYFETLIGSKHYTKDNRLYLQIRNFKKDYFNLFPHIYKKYPTARKVAIIPNKLFQLTFFDNDKYIDPYQSLFDAVTEAVTIEEVEVVDHEPKLLVKAARIKLSEKDAFHFYKVAATVNEISIKEALDNFFSEMKEITDVISVTEFYKTTYMPKLGESFTPVSERIITTNVLYNPDTDFDYHQMEYAKKGALVHEYFFRAGLSTFQDSTQTGGGARLIELQDAYNTTIYPQESLYVFEYISDKDDYYEIVEDYYDDLDDAMDINEEALSSDDLDFEVIRLTATVDEVMLASILNELKGELVYFLKKEKEKEEGEEEEEDW